MKNKQLGMIFILVLAAGVSTIANATLFDRGNGLIYDSDQDLTWLQDANYAMTSGYDADGKMNWSMATGWADGLSFEGYDDWRLATVTDTGGPGCDESFNNTDCGYNVDISGSELAYMWYDILGNSAFFNTSGAEGGCSGSVFDNLCLTSTSADGVNIANLQSDIYWSGTEYAPSDGNAWAFWAGLGNQNASYKLLEQYAWAVRSGDVAATVPEPGTIALMIAGLFAMSRVTRRRG